MITQPGNAFHDEAKHTVTDGANLVSRAADEVRLARERFAAVTRVMNMGSRTEQEHELARLRGEFSRKTDGLVWAYSRVVDALEAGKNSA